MLLSYFILYKFRLLKYIPSKLSEFNNWLLNMYFFFFGILKRAFKIALISILLFVLLVKLEITSFPLE